MKRLALYTLLAAFLILLPLSQPALAQTYSFSVEREIVDVYWESDGSLTVGYEMTLSNDPIADPMEFIDIGVPTEEYDLARVRGWVNGQPITHIAPSTYVSQAIEFGLGDSAIQPSRTGVVKLIIPGIQNVLYEADEEGYASGLFSPSFFDSDLVHGATELTVRFHLPPGVQPDEPRWHEAPGNWPHESPQTGLDEEGRILYTWHNPQASPSRAYVFGTSFPEKYIPAGIIQRPSLLQRLGISRETLSSLCCFGGIGLLVVLFVILGITTRRRRKLAYLPPKMSIEGHGIKRGLTAVEAAILLQTPLDKILTMILFSLIKKGAARVEKEDPLEIEALTPEPEGLRAYESDFLAAMKKRRGAARHKALQQLMIKHVQSVQKKMKGFSLKETKDYYQSIMKKAWKQIEEAETPEVRSERYAEAIEWTMMDREFEDRTRRTFRTGPVFVPLWWGNYRPSARTSMGPTLKPAAGTTVSHSKGGALPQLPGGEFAASMVSGVQNTAGSLVSNVVDFTGKVTKTTNPPPPPPKASSGGWSGGGGSSCACACACAGCACACAGGGR